MALGFHTPRFSDVTKKALRTFVSERKIVKFSDLCREFSEYNDKKSLDFFRSAADECGYVIIDYNGFTERLKDRRNIGLLKEVYSLIFPNGRDRDKGQLRYIVISNEYHKKLKQRAQGDGLEARVSEFMEKMGACSFEALCGFCGLKPGRRALERLKALGADCGYVIEKCEDFLHLLNASGNKGIEAQAYRLLVPFKKKSDCFVAISKKAHDALKKKA
jgi:hypothetical protein